MADYIKERIFKAVIELVGSNEYLRWVKKVGGEKIAIQLIEKEITKQIFKQGSKATLNFGAKKIPLLGAIIGVFYLIWRLLSGDIFGAVLELISGVASTIPGIGTSVSTVIDTFLYINDTARIVIFALAIF